MADEAYFLHCILTMMGATLAGDGTGDGDEVDAYVWVSGDGGVWRGADDRVEAGCAREDSPAGEGDSVLVSIAALAPVMTCAVDMVEDGRRRWPLAVRLCASPTQSYL